MLTLLLFKLKHLAEKLLLLFTVAGAANVVVVVVVPPGQNKTFSKQDVLIVFSHNMKSELRTHLKTFEDFQTC